MQHPEDDPLGEDEELELEMAELSELAELHPEALESELENARDGLLTELRELLDEVMSGEVDPEEAIAELDEDLQEFDLECEDNPFLPDFPDLAAGWREATETISEGYNLMLMGIDQNQPEFLQAGYLMVEDGLYRRDAILDQG